MKHPDEAWEHASLTFNLFLFPLAITCELHVLLEPFTIQLFFLATCNFVKQTSIGNFQQAILEVVYFLLWKFECSILKDYALSIILVPLFLESIICTSNFKQVAPCAFLI